MICVALCAGKGSRLGDLTSDLPKTLLPIDGDTTILDTIFQGVSPHVERFVVVAGYQADVLKAAVAEMADVSVHVVEDVDRWNNARSLWSSLRDLDDDVLVVNGDTVVHPSATRALLAGASGHEVALAVDTTHALGEEEMKVIVDADGHVQQISKLLEPADCHGEYIGQSVIAKDSIAVVSRHLEVSWNTRPQSYYEDGYQLAINSGVRVGSVALPDIPWTEVDDTTDLKAARCLAWL